VDAKIWLQRSKFFISLGANCSDIQYHSQLQNYGHHKCCFLIFLSATSVNKYVKT